MMKCFYKCALLFQALFFNASIAQVVADGWVLESIHGPSQMGIVDTIAVDINHDGLMDVVSASIDDGHLRAYINQGGSTELSNVVFEEMFISKQVPGIYRVSEIDINHDGQVDFLLPSIESQEIILLVADSTAQPYGYRKQIIASDILLPTDAQAGDFNRDGLVDVVSVSFELNRVYLHLQNLQGTFDTQIIADSILRPRKILVENYNNDAQMDFMVVSSEDDSVRLFENQGDALFDEQLISNQMTGARFIASCDIDGNGWVDFVVSATSIDSVYSFTNLGNGAFTEQLIDANLPGASSIHCADIDDDNQDELIGLAGLTGTIYTQELNSLDKQLIASNRDGYVSVILDRFVPSDTPTILTQTFFENRNLFYGVGQENHELVVWEDFPESPSDLVLGDINNDGIDDLVVASFGDGVIQWFNGLNYEQRLVAENIDGVTEIRLADMNQDGMLDVVSAAANGNSFYWHENTIDQEFNTRLIHNNFVFPTGLDVIDIDGDNDLDVIGIASSEESIKIFMQQDDGSFQIFEQQQFNFGNVDVMATDLDSDSKPDILILNFFSGTIEACINKWPLPFSCRIILAGQLRPYHLESIDKNNFFYSESGNNSVWKMGVDAQLNVDMDLVSDRANNPRKMSLLREATSLMLFVSELGGDSLQMAELKTNNEFTVSLIASKLFGSNAVYSSFENGRISSYSTSIDNNGVHLFFNNTMIFENDFEPK